jgi:pimeloyl-ACP methyl ester carboxylesterase
MTSRTCRRTWRKLLRDRHDVPPSLFFSIREAYLGYAEFITSAPVSVLTKKEHSGDGRPVLVIPGFTGSDLYNYPLISFLRRKGYHAKGWNLGRNFGHGFLNMDKLVERVAKLYHFEGQPVTLIGHSLGGVYARELAKRCPEHVRMVISLGSPFGEDRDKASRWDGLYQLVKPSGASDTEGEWSKPPHVPCVAIYSVCDGVVNWRVTRQKDNGANCRNFKVRGSHVGLTNNKNVWRIIYNCLQ